MNFSSKQSKIVPTRDVPSHDFKRALSTAVTITTSPLKYKSSTKPKDDDAGNAEKALENIEKELKLRKFLAAGKESVAAIRERVDQRFIGDSDSSLSSAPNSQERRNAYNFELSDLSDSSNDDLFAKGKIDRGKCLRRDELEAIDRSDYSKKSSSTAVRSKRRSWSVSPPPRKKHKKSVGKVLDSPAKIKSRSHKSKRSKESSKDKSHRKREKEKAKERERLRKVKEQLRIQSDKLEKLERFGEGKHRNISTHNKFESLYASRSDDSDDDERHARREGGRREKYRPRVSCIDEKSPRRRETDYERRKYCIKDGDDCEWSEISTSRKSGTASARSYVRYEKLDAISYRPSTLRTGIMSRLRREENASYHYTNARRTDQYYYPSDEYVKRGDEYDRRHKQIDPPSKTSPVNDDLVLERGSIHRRYFDPNGNTSKVLEAAPKPTKTITDDPEASAAKMDVELSEGQIVDDHLSDISSETDSPLDALEVIASHNQYNEPTNESIAESSKAMPLIPVTRPGGTLKTEEIKVKSERPEPNEGFFSDIDENSDTSLTYVSTDAKLESDVEPIDDIELDFDGIDLDFDKILEDYENEKESEVCAGTFDALGADWANLIEESKAAKQQKSKEEPCASQRWQSHRILLDAGVSFKMAGAKFAKRTLLDAQQKLAPTPHPSSADVIETKFIKKENGIKCELAEIDASQIYDVSETCTVSTDSEKLHPVAAAQVAKWSAVDSLVFHATGPYSRGLSAKRDIAIRRQLCNLPSNENISKTMIQYPYTRYEDMAIKLFQRALATHQ